MTEKRTRANGQGSIWYDDARGRWCVKVMVDGHARRGFVTGYDNKTKAVAKLDKMRATAAEGKATPSGNTTVAELLDRWFLKSLRNNRKITDLSEFKWSIAIWKVELGTKRLRSLTTDDVERALERRANPRRLGKPVSGTGATGQAIKPLGVRSLRLLRGHLRRALTWGVARQDLTWNCAMVAELPEAAPSQNGRSMTQEQADRFFAVAQGTRLGALWTLMLLTALRPGEAGGLLWSDVDFEAEIIHVQPNEVRGVKTKSSLRDIGVPATALDALRTHGTNQMLDGVSSDLVFLSPTGKPLDPSKMRREFKLVAIAAGLDRSWHPHELRHTALSLLKAAGQPMQDLTDLAGHSETRTTETLYVKRLTPATKTTATMQRLFPGLD